jgi:hypothetical protein
MPFLSRKYKLPNSPKRGAAPENHETHHTSLAHPRKSEVFRTNMQIVPLFLLFLRRTNRPAGRSRRTGTKARGDHGEQSAQGMMTKSMTGHLLGATGALEAMFSVKAIQEDIIPPTINHDPEDLDENIDYNLNFTFDRAQNRPVRAALSNSFGFGGHNATVIFKKYE